jgi:hypothetical protein
MNATKEIRRENAWIKRKVKADKPLRDEEPYMDYEFQLPEVWRDNIVTWAKVMLIVMFLAFSAGMAIPLIEAYAQ